MAKRVRAKFTCMDKEDDQVKLMAVTQEQDAAFWEATPAGHVEMWIDNENGLAFFEQGKDYFLDFVVAE